MQPYTTRQNRSEQTFTCGVFFWARGGRLTDHWHSLGQLKGYIQLLMHFLDGYERKDGDFFRALADALETKGNPKWSKRESSFLPSATRGLR